MSAPNNHATPATDIPDLPDYFGTEVVSGREPPPHTQAPDWVTYADIDPLARFLHTVLKSHVNRERGDSRSWPSTRSLAKVLHLGRRDKVAPLLKQLASIGAIEIRGEKMPRRNVYVVHSMPPAGYTGPLTLTAWYEANRAELAADAAAEKAKRDDRQQRAKAQARPVTPNTGQQAVTPVAGQQGTPVAGQLVTPPAGREPDVREQDEEEQLKPLPAPPGRPAGQDSRNVDDEGKSQPAVQPTLTGEVPAPREPSTRDRAMGIAGWWMAEWKERAGGKDIAGTNVKHLIRCAVEKHIKAGYTDAQVKQALVYVCRGVPLAGLLEAALIQVERGWQAPEEWVPGDVSHRRTGAGVRVNGQSRAGARVNDYWDTVRAAEAAKAASGDRASAGAR